MRTGTLAILASSVLAACGRAGADRPATPPALPGGFGLAAKYPNDAGIGRDAAVLLAEDFERGEIADLGKRWTEVSNKDGKPLAFVADAPKGSTGRRSLEITAT